VFENPVLPIPRIQGDTVLHTFTSNSSDGQITYFNAHNFFLIILYAKVKPYGNISCARSQQKT
jgi:hypothetical protein